MRHYIKFISCKKNSNSEKKSDKKNDLKKQDLLTIFFFFFIHITELTDFSLNVESKIFHFKICF